MPKQQLLPRLISVLSPEERTAYPLWIEMELCRKDSNHLRWFQHLWRHLEGLGFPEGLATSVMNSCWEACFPHISHQSRQMVHLNQDLCRYTERFIAYQKTRQFQDDYEADLAFSLLERQHPRLFLRYYNRTLRRFRALQHEHQDFRTMLAYNQLLRVGASFQHFAHKGGFIKDFVPLGREEQSRVHELASAVYVVERSLFKLDYQMELHTLERESLHILSENLNHLPVYMPLILALFTWFQQDGPPGKQELLKAMDGLESSLDHCRIDLATNIINLLIQGLTKWQSRELRVDFITSQVKAFRYLLKRGIIMFNRSYFLYLVRMYLLSVNVVYPRVEAKSKGIRLKKISGYLDAARESLQTHGKKLSQEDKESASRVLEILIAFEEEDNQKLESLFSDMSRSAFFDPLFEIHARWTKAKYLFLLEDEDRLEMHLSRFRSYLQTHKKEGNNHVNTARQALISLTHLRRMKTSRLETYGEQWLKEIQSPDLEVLDKPWLIAMLTKEMSA